jgi:hypothetical protein
VKILSSVLPSKSKLARLVPVYDFVECFYAQKNITGEVTAEFVFKSILNDPPLFVMVILKIRDFFFRIVGLKTSDITNPIKFVDLPIQRERPLVSDMDMSYNSLREVIWGIKDKHLNFAISVYVTNTEVQNQNNCEVYVSTILKYNNTWGRIYFAALKPIHSFVIRLMMKKMMQSL